jgi:hypothetical protein
MAQVVARLPSKREAQSSNSSPGKTKKQKKTCRCEFYKNLIRLKS